MSFFAELRRRNVLRIGAAYLAVTWVLIQVADTLVPVMNAPAWFLQVLVLAAALGFPFALVLAWFYELTPDGVKTTPHGEALEPSKFLGRKIDFAIIGLLVLAVSVLIVDSYVLKGGVAREASIAVLPFTNDSATEENAEFLANGMHEELLTQLAKIRSLKVISRASVMGYRDGAKSMRAIGRELGVATILAGGVQRAGDEIRVNVQLVDAETDEPLWAESYNRALTAENVFAIQGEMAAAIAGALQATLLPTETVALDRLPTQNTEAYEFYLLGNDYMNQVPNKEWTPRAIRMYEQAVERDPQFAEAWAALSRALAVNRDVEGSRDALEEALILAPDLPEVDLARGRYLHAIGEYRQALQAYATAELGLPGDATLLRSQANTRRDIGEFEEAASLMARAVELDPFNAELNTDLAWIYLWLRRYDDAEQRFNRALEIRPDYFFSYFGGKLWLLLCRGENGDLVAVRAAVDNPPSEFPNGLEAYSIGWQAALFQEDYDAALSYLDRWDVEADDNNFEYIPKAYLYGVTLQLAGRPAEAQAQFRSALENLRVASAANPADERFLLAFAQVQVGLGNQEEARHLVGQLTERMASWREAWPPPIFTLNIMRLDLITSVLAPLQDRDALIAQLDTYLSGPGDFSIEAIGRDPRLDFIRDDPEFRALVETYRRK